MSDYLGNPGGFTKEAEQEKETVSASKEAMVEPGSPGPDRPATTEIQTDPYDGSTSYKRRS